MTLEYPTGWVADRLGHRASLIAGSLVQVGAMLLCWQASGLVSLAAAIVLVALGDALRSGADQALLYRTCVALDREGAFQRMEARSHAAGLVGLVALVVTGGFVVETWGFTAGWIAEALLSAVGLGLAFAFVEPPAAVPPPDDSVAEAQRITRIPLTMAALVLPASGLGAASAAALFVAQTAHGITPGESTALVAVAALVEASGTALAGRVTGAGRGTQMMLGAMGAGIAAMAVLVPALLVPTAAALTWLAGFAEPLRSAAVQRLASDQARARAASAASACDMAISAVTLPIAGWFR